MASAYNRSTLSSFSVDLLNTGNSNYRWGLFLNPTLTGGTAASWAQAGSNSFSEIDLASTAVVSGGYEITGGYGTGGSTRQVINQDINSPVVLSSNIAGTSDVLVLAIQAATGSDAFLGSIGWKEYH